MCVGWAGDGHSGVVSYEDTPLFVWDALGDPETPTVAHSTFDWRFLKLAGHSIRGPFYDTRRMAHLLDENTPLSLEWLADSWLNLKMDKRLHRRDKKVWFRCDDGQTLLLEEAFEQFPQQVMAYCHRDCRAERDLYQALHKAMNKALWTRYWLEEEVPFTGVLVNMETAGLPINLTQATELKAKLETEVAGREAKLLADVGYEFNLGSGDQLAQVLFQEMWWQEASIDIEPTEYQKKAYNEYVKLGGGLVFPEWRRIKAQQSTPNNFEVQRIGRTKIHGHYFRKGFGWPRTPLTESGKRPSTSSPDLMVHHSDKPFVKDLVEYRKHEKVITTYLEGYPEHTRDGRLYGRFNQAGTVTGRLSSSEPNLMNQPRRGPLGKAIRSLFQGNLIVGDHSQLESRLAAHFSMDPTLLEVYRKNEDIYLKLAHFIFGGNIEKGDERRDLCKTLWLGSQYGAFPPKLARTMCLNGFPTTEKEASGYLEELHSWVPVLFKWREYVIQEARDKGFVKTIGGRYRRLKPAFEKGAPWKMQSRGERQAVNSIIQGSAADILRRNMLHTDDFFRITLLAQVHDELVWEHDIPKTGVMAHMGFALAERIKATCENPDYKLDVPLLFEPVFCNSWAEKDSPPGKDVEVEEEVA